MKKYDIKCLDLLKNVVTMSFLSCNALNAIPLKHVSMNNEVCRIRP